MSHIETWKISVKIMCCGGRISPSWRNSHQMVSKRQRKVSLQHTLMCMHTHSCITQLFETISPSNSLSLWSPHLKKSEISQVVQWPITDNLQRTVMFMMLFTWAKMNMNLAGFWWLKIAENLLENFQAWCKQIRDKIRK